MESQIYAKCGKCITEIKTSWANPSFYAVRNKDQLSKATVYVLDYMNQQYRHGVEVVSV